MRDIPLGFDPAEIRREINGEPWQHHQRAVALGSVTSLNPSGKYYMPYACSNLDPCPVCHGEGSVRVTVKRRLVRKWTNENKRRRRLWVQRYPGGVYTWPREVQAASEALNRRLARTRGECPRCAGCRSAEAHDDELWYEKAVDALARVGLSLESDPGDPTQLLAVEYLDAPELDGGYEDEVG